MPRDRSRPSTSVTRRSTIPAARWRAVRLFAMDVDGVLTDGTVTISADGNETKLFSILDGHGLKHLHKTGILVAWISGRASGATTRRASELEIQHVVQGRTDKLVVLRDLAGQLGFSARECAYMGDDEIDAPAIAWAGVGIAPPGAMPSAIAAADYITEREAGHGAVREVCEHLLAARATEPRNPTRGRRTKRR